MAGHQKRFWFFLSLLLTAALLTACSTTKNGRDYNLAFQTRITAGGLKHFQFSRMDSPRLQAIRIDPNSRKRQDHSYANQERRAKRIRNYLRKELESKMAETRFCRDGYWFLDRDLFGLKTWIRGECNELASEADRKNFPDTILQW